jgi:osmotically inducible lipoprotein OsmB
LALIAQFSLHRSIEPLSNRCAALARVRKARRLPILGHNRLFEAIMLKSFIAMAVFAASAGLAGCSTWDKLDQSEKGAVIGAGVGGAAGAAVSDGNPLGTAAGAAVGGVVGHQVGKNREKD